MMIMMLACSSHALHEWRQGSSSSNVTRGDTPCVAPGNCTPPTRQKHKNVIVRPSRYNTQNIYIYITNNHTYIHRLDRSRDFSGISMVDSVELSVYNKLRYRLGTSTYTQTQKHTHVHTQNRAWISQDYVRKANAEFKGPFVMHGNTKLGYGT